MGHFMQERSRKLLSVQCDVYKVTDKSSWEERKRKVVRMRV